MKTTATTYKTIQPAATPTTPYLTIHTQTVTDAYRALQQALPGVHIFYAVKSNSDPTLARHLHKIGCSFEIASAPEMELLRAQGVDPAELLFTNPVKVPAHIEQAARAGVWRFSFDSHAELEKIVAAAPGASVFVRLAAPAYESGVASEGKFGIDTTAACLLMQEAVSLGLKPYGISFHVGSQMESPEPWDAAITMAGELMRQLQGQGITIHMLDIGGGFPAFYGQQLPDIGEYGAYIMKSLAAHIPYTVEIAAEPGRYMVANAGVLTTTIIGVAERQDKTWLHLDAGAFNGLMEALETGNTLRFPVSDEQGSKTTALYQLTGPSCDSQDSILFDVPLSTGLQVGDKILIHTAGAYTTCYASTFNGFSIPTTIVV